MSAADSETPRITVSRTQFTDAFLALEKQLPIPSYTYKGKNVWPIARRFVMYDFFRKQHKQDIHTGSATAQETTPSPVVQQQITVSKRDYLKQIQSLSEKHKGKVLFFFSATQKPSDQINDLGYFRHSDPYFEKLSERYDAVRIQVSSSTSPQTGKLTHPLEIIQSGNLVMDEMRKLGRLRRLFLKPTLGKVKEADDALRSKIAALDAGYLLPQNGVAGFAERVFAWEELLTPFIEKLKPKAVFMPCYFCDQQTLGLTAACHKAGVPVIDIQHGGQDNPMYYGWQGAAAESPYLADYFWMWSDYFTEFTAANNSGAKGVPFTGGNFWMQKSLSSIPVTEPVAAL
ncbi:MAG: hypothetical protein ACRC3B_08260, partial [Bacteroidia bacterium]